MSDETRFWRYVNKTETCWLWTGASSDGRYGDFWFQGKHIRAHRFIWQTIHGPIPTGKVICHHCDVPACVRPDHLFIGALSDNSKDARRKGRLLVPQERGTIPWRKLWTQCPQGHPFDAVNTYINPTTKERRCRACAKNNRQAYLSKQQALDGRG